MNAYDGVVSLVDDQTEPAHGLGLLNDLEYHSHLQRQVDWPRDAFFGPRDHNAISKERDKCLKFSMGENRPPEG